LYIVKKLYSSPVRQFVAAQVQTDIVYGVSVRRTIPQNASTRVELTRDGAVTVREGSNTKSAESQKDRSPNTFVRRIGTRIDDGIIYFLFILHGRKALAPRRSDQRDRGARDKVRTDESIQILLYTYIRYMYIYIVLSTYIHTIYWAYRAYHIPVVHRKRIYSWHLASAVLFSHQFATISSPRWPPAPWRRQPRRHLFNSQSTVWSVLYCTVLYFVVHSDLAFLFL
jgi:hypothetical protein